MMSQKELSQSLLETEAKRLRRTWRLTPEQRMERFHQLQATAEKTLASNPQAHAAFQRRNDRRRRLSQVIKLMRRLHEPVSPAPDQR